MNLSKSYVLGIIIALSVLTYSQALAGSTSNIPTVDSTHSSSVLVASIDIKDATIISQDNNIFNISFGLVNRGNLQTGVNYEVKAVSDVDKSVIDEKVYDDSLTLNKGDFLQKDVIYTAPTYLNGGYTLYLNSINVSGLPFDSVVLGKVNLVASTKIVQISPNECFLTIDGEKNNPHYTLTQNIDIGIDELLVLHCTAINATDKDLSMTPFFETREFGAYGNIAQQNGGDYTAIDFKKGETKSFSITLPKGDRAMFYDTKMQLMSGEDVSNPISSYYILRGVNSRVYQLSLDKDFYQKGEHGEISFVWSAPSSKYIRGGIIKGIDESVKLDIFIKNDRGIECIQPIEKILSKDINTPQVKIPFSVQSDCLNPHVSTTLTDNTGKVLDQENFAFKTSLNKNIQNHKKTNYLVLIIVIIILIGFAIYLKKKNRSIEKK